MVWSIFTGEVVDYGTILQDDFIQYVGKGSPKEGINKLTSARFWSLYLVDLHKEVGFSLGEEINCFSCRDLKKYSLPKDQSIFGSIRQLPMHILDIIGQINFAVTNHIEDTNDIAPYCYTPPSPIHKTTGLVFEPKLKRLKTTSKRKTLTKSASKGVGGSKKRKTIIEHPKVTKDPIMTEDPIQIEELVNMNEKEDVEATYVFEDLFRKKKLKLHTPLSQKRPTLHIGDSQKSPVAIRFIVESPSRTLTSTPLQKV